MSAALSTLLGAVGAVGAILAVLVPLIRAQGASLRRELDHLRADVAADAARVRADVAEVRRDVHALGERVARIEGALTGPWRPPANGPTTASTEPPPRTRDEALGRAMREMGIDPEAVQGEA